MTIRPEETNEGAARVCANCETRGEPFFCGIVKNGGKDLVGASEEFPRGVVLFAEGQRPRGVYLLCQGRVKLIGASRETVTRLLNEFKRRKIVEAAGTTLLVRDRAALEALALPR
jgi:hypothetical protein